MGWPPIPVSMIEQAAGIGRNAASNDSHDSETQRALRFDAYIFDLDGTLLDTLPDLVRLTNKVLSERGWPERTREEILSFVGDGGRVLLGRAAPASARANEVEAALNMTDTQSLAKTLWRKLERIIAFGAGELYDATARMKQFTGQIPHNNGFYYTEESFYGRAVADDSDLFETLPSGIFHEYLPLDEDKADTVFSTDTKPGALYQLVVTNSAGLYRYVTDHTVRIKETQMDKILFTIY